MVNMDYTATEADVLSPSGPLRSHLRMDNQRAACTSQPTVPYATIGGLLLIACTVVKDLTGISLTGLGRILVVMVVQVCGSVSLSFGEKDTLVGVCEIGEQSLIVVVDHTYLHQDLVASRSD